jgi:tight adherence protein C
MMEGLSSLLENNLEAVVLFAIFGAVVLVVLAVMSSVKERIATRQRLAVSQSSDAVDHRSNVSLRIGDENIGLLGRALKSIEHHILPTDMEELSESRKKMIRAGYKKPSAVRIYYFMRGFLGLAAPAIILLLSPELSRTMSWEKIYMLTAISGLIGMYSPVGWVSMKTSSRQQACREGFPDTLDMLLVCVEAGLGLDAAINRVAAEIGKAHPILAEHFQQVGAELRAGRSREVALRNMADKIGVEEVGSLITMLVQSEMLGTSIAQALRVHSEDMRMKRMMRAEEKAHMLPVKMTVPLILGILPPLVLVILAPAIINFMQVKG